MAVTVAGRTGEMVPAVTEKLMWKTFVTGFHISKNGLSLLFPTKSDMAKLHQAPNCIFHLYVFGKPNYVALIIIFGGARTSRSSSGPELEEAFIFCFVFFSSIEPSNWASVVGVLSEGNPCGPDSRATKIGSLLTVLVIKICSTPVLYFRLKRTR